MKWHITTKSEKFELRVEKLSKWHYWFAWFPVCIEHEGNTYRIWLETVGRKLKVYDEACDMYYSRKSIARPEYCLKDDVVANILKE